LYIDVVRGDETLNGHAAAISVQLRITMSDHPYFCVKVYVLVDVERSSIHQSCPVAADVVHRLKIGWEQGAFSS
jgi:hypothetical protein